jgi:hypothetical protein
VGQRIASLSRLGVTTVMIVLCRLFRRTVCNLHSVFTVLLKTRLATWDWVSKLAVTNDFGGYTEGCVRTICVISHCMSLLTQVYRHFIKVLQ